MTARPVAAKRHFWRSPAGLIAVCGIAAFLFANTKCVCTAIRFAEIKAQQGSRFKGVLVGMEGYNDNVGQLPAAITWNSAGEPCCSWRLALVAFLEGNKTPRELDQRWDSLANSKMAAQRLIFFSFTRSRPDQPTIESQMAVVIGPGTPIQEKHSMKLEDIPGDTILIVEAPDVSSHWMKPGDVYLDRIDEAFLQGSDGRGVMVGFADGEVWLLEPSAPLEDFKLFLVAQPERARDRARMLGPHRLPFIARN